MSERFKLYKGNCLTELSNLEDNSIDSIVTDPPYGLEFMGKEWDKGVPGDIFWKEILRVAKPGAHLVAFGGSRTHHRLMCAIEDAGWEIRDCLMWLYGSGFPKSMDISKAIDKKSGVERESQGFVPSGGGDNYDAWRKGEGREDRSQRHRTGMKEITSPATDSAKQWDGWGTALKPAWEPIILARKPIEGTVVNNVLTHGVGGINIDACRIVTEENLNGGAYARNGKQRTGTWVETRKGDTNSYKIGGAGEYVQPSGRWPANLILNEDAGKILDEQTGVLKSGAGAVKKASAAGSQGNALGKENRPVGTPMICHGDSGGASRFFYCPKVSKTERNMGGVTNDHPTVKPVALMSWLCKLVTPIGGVILDPFMGSGSTGIAAIQENFNFIGVDLSEHNVEIARGRISSVSVVDVPVNNFFDWNV